MVRYPGKKALAPFLIPFDPLDEFFYVPPGKNFVDKFAILGP
jgi:hypothetical protein